MPKTDYVAKAQERGEADKQVLEHETSMVGASPRTTGWKDSMWGALARGAADFWMAAFPYFLVAGIAIFALATYLGLSVWVTIKLLVFIGIGVFCLGAMMR